MPPPPPHSLSCTSAPPRSKAPPCRWRIRSPYRRRPIGVSALPERGSHAAVTHHGAVTTLAPPATRGARPLRLRLALFAAVTLLAASNVVSNRLWPQGYLVWNLAMTGVLLLLARAAGLTRADLGLGGERLRRGLLLGAGAAAVVGLLYATAVALPATRTAFVDARGA